MDLIVETLGNNVSYKKGFAFKSDWFIREGTPIIKVSDFTEDSINPLKVVYVDEKIANENREYTVFHNDVIIQTVGSWPNNPKSVVGKVVKVPKELNGALLNQNAVVIHPNKNIDNKFLYYLLRSENFKYYIINTAQGAANQASITLDSIFRYTFLCPSIPIQKKIAAILSTYDDLIENNKRRIDILEKIAEEIFNEWFVRLRFPGHGQEKIIKGIPIGWPIKKVIEIINRHGFGRIYREKELAQTGQIVVIDQSEKKALGYYNGEPEHRASLRIPIILFGDHSCKMQIMTNPFSLAENVIPFRAKDGLSTIFLYYLTKNLIKTTEYKRHWTEFIHKEIILPPIKLQNEFSKIAMYHIQLGEMLESVNDNLQYSRNLLLLRLLSGKLSVEDLDIQFPKSMEDDYAEFHQ